MTTTTYKVSGMTCEHCVNAGLGGEGIGAGDGDVAGAEVDGDVADTVDLGDLGGLVSAPARLAAFALALAVILAGSYGIGAATGIDGADPAPTHEEHTP